MDDHSYFNSRATRLTVVKLHEFLCFSFLFVVILPVSSHFRFFPILVRVSSSFLSVAFVLILPSSSSSLFFAVYLSQFLFFSFCLFFNFFPFFFFSFSSVSFSFCHFFYINDHLSHSTAFIKCSEVASVGLEFFSSNSMSSFLFFLLCSFLFFLFVLVLRFLLLSTSFSFFLLPFSQLLSVVLARSPFSPFLFFPFLSFYFLPHSFFPILVVLPLSPSSFLPILLFLPRVCFPNSVAFLSFFPMHSYC